jgi:hypothetical protein
MPYRVAIGFQLLPLTVKSGLTAVIAILPVVGHAGVAKNEPDQIGEGRLGANIVRQDDNTMLAGLDADHSVSGSRQEGQFDGHDLLT